MDEPCAGDEARQEDGGTKQSEEDAVGCVPEIEETLKGFEKQVQL